MEQVARTAKALGKLVILNPAPARRLPADLLRHVDVVTPNETEAEMLTGIRVQTVADARAAADKLLETGARMAVITLGERGALVATHDYQAHVPARRVTPVDTVAAGDAFNAGLAVALGGGSGLAEAVEFANCTAAIAVTRHGAQPSMPYRDEVLALVANPD